MSATRKIGVAVAALIAFYGGMAILAEVSPDHGALLNHVQRGDVGQLRTYLDRGADPNVRYTFQSGFLRRGRRGFKSGWREQPLLLHAMEIGNVQVALLLLER